MYIRTSWVRSTWTGHIAKTGIRFLLPALPCFPVSSPSSSRSSIPSLAPPLPRPFLRPLHAQVFVFVLAIRVFRSQAGGQDAKIRPISFVGSCSLRRGGATESPFGIGESYVYSIVSISAVLWRRLLRWWKTVDKLVTYSGTRESDRKPSSSSSWRQLGTQNAMKENYTTFNTTTWYGNLYLPSSPNITWKDKVNIN